MNLELVGALNELERERGISKEILLEAIEAAILSAYKRGNERVENVRVDVSEKNGSIRVFAQKRVVEVVEDEANEISLDAAREIDPNYEVGSIVEIEETPRDFGRIAAQTAKQVVIQRIREAERSVVFEEYANREGDVVTGIVQRTEYRNVLVDLGKVEAILPPGEQMQKETYPHGARIKVYISEVRQTPKGPQVIVSRTHPGLLKRLFELEVPEIHDGIVEIMAVSREAGNRSKIAVKSNDLNVDPVGACVGPRGMRVQSIVQELKGEKIDIIEYSSDPERFVAKALSPARVIKVYINEEEKSARAVVPDHQLSLAIGREGQNARLAARLTGWKVDIKSEAQMAELALLEAQRAAEERRARELEEAARAAAEEQAVLAPEATDQPTDEQPEAALVASVEEASGDVSEMVDADAALGAEETVLESVTEAAVSPEEVSVAETEQPVAESEEEPTIDLTIPPELFDELDDDREKVEPAPAKVRKNRAARKELQSIIEEDVLEDEDEPLPSLFDGEDDETAEDEPVVYSSGSSTGSSAIESFMRRWSQQPAATAGKKKDADKKAVSKKKKKADDKVVLKDLSQLAALLEQEDDEA